MKIAILGTKGIPNNYGGFEQFAEFISVELTALGHDVTVYNPSFHPYKENSFKGVSIVTIHSPERILGGAANFIYDHLCLTHALKQNYDVIYEAGYHSVAFSFWLLGIRKMKRPVVVTNMDGLEWMRSKWNFFTRILIKKLEKIAVNNCNHLISDNTGIQKYYQETFGKASTFLPYGANMVKVFDAELLKKYEVSASNYFMLIARLEPENNIELILDGFLQSGLDNKFIVVGGVNSKYGKYLIQKYKSTSLVFTSGIYNINELNSLRHYSRAYFHGHSVGGTNPSLLEAMACNCFIFAHNNDFNRGVLGEQALYFSTPADIKAFLHSIDSLRMELCGNFVTANNEKIEQIYNWTLITSRHEALFKSLLESSK